MSILINGITAKQLEDVFSWARIGANNCMIGYGVTAIELPDHGDLIDRVPAIDELRERIHANGYTNVALVSELNRSIGYLMRLPAVIPAERSEE